MFRDITCGVILGLCVLFLLPTTTTGITSNALEGSPQILSFTAETWNPFERHWKSSTDVRRGDHIRLICTIDDDSDSEVFIIRRLDEENVMEPLTYPSRRQIGHEFRSVDCDKTATYVCEAGHGVSKTMDLKVFDCSPQILSFTHEEWDLSQNQWKTDTDIERGTDIRLVCTINGPFSEQFKIRKLHETNALAPLESPNLRQIVYVFRNLDCEITGTYVCEDGQGVNRTMDLAVYNCSPPMPILSFAFEEWDSAQNQWRSSTEIESGDDVRLICTIDGPFSENYTIRNQQETNPLQVLVYPNSRQVIHEFRNVNCDKTGTYICENGNGASKTVELGIFNCGPRFCDEEEASTTTLVIGLREAKLLRVCVRAFPDINVAMTPSTATKSSAETKVGGQHTSIIPATAKETADQSPWDVDVQPKPHIFGAYYVFMSKTVLSRDDYGEQTVIIYTTHKGQRKELSYTIVLQPPDMSPPDCPTNLKVTDPKADNVMLSWQPGQDGGSIQFFLIYLSTDDEIWTLFGNETEENSIRVTGLQEETQYSFRVESANKLFQAPSGNRCESTVRVKTGQHIKAGDHSTKYIVLAAVLCSVVAATIVAVIVIVTHKKRSRENMSISLLVGDITKVFVEGSNNAKECATPDSVHEGLLPGRIK